MASQHHEFVHAAMPTMIFRDPAWALEALRSIDRARWLRDQWVSAGKRVSPEEQHPADELPAVIERPGNDRTLVLVRMPPPRARGEAYMVAIVAPARPDAPSYNWVPAVRYFTLERGDDSDAGDPGTVLGERTRDLTHRAHGPVPANDAEAFVRAVRAVLKAEQPRRHPRVLRPALTWSLALVPFSLIAIFVAMAAAGKARMPDWMPALTRPDLDGAELVAELEEDLRKDTGVQVQVSCPEKIAWGSVDVCTGTYDGESFSIAIDVQPYGSYSYDPVQMVSNRRMVVDVREALQEDAENSPAAGEPSNATTVSTTDRVDCPPLVIARAGRRAECLVFNDKRARLVELRFTSTNVFSVHPK